MALVLVVIGLLSGCQALDTGAMRIVGEQIQLTICGQVRATGVELRTYPKGKPSIDQKVVWLAEGDVFFSRGTDLVLGLEPPGMTEVLKLPTTFDEDDRLVVAIPSEGRTWLFGADFSALSGGEWINEEGAVVDKPCV